MSDEQSIRDEARAYIHKKHPEWHDNGVGIVQGSHYRSGFADGAEWALADSSVVRRIQAEAWDAGYVDGATDGFNRSQGNTKPNPYRKDAS